MRLPVQLYGGDRRTSVLLEVWVHHLTAVVLIQHSAYWLTLWCLPQTSSIQRKLWRCRWGAEPNCCVAIATLTICWGEVACAPCTPVRATVLLALGGDSGVVDIPAPPSTEVLDAETMTHCGRTVFNKKDWDCSDQHYVSQCWEYFLEPESY